MDEHPERRQRLDRIDELCRILPPPWGVWMFPLDEAARQLEQEHEPHEDREGNHMRVGQACWIAALRLPTHGA